MAKQLLILLFAVIFLTSCASAAEGVELNQAANDAISTYIVEHYKGVYSASDKSFEVHKIYGATKTGNELTVYMYSLYSGFNKNSEKSMNGHSLPAVVKLKEVEAGNYTVTSYKEPEDGEENSTSIKAMFPTKYHAQIWEDLKKSNLQDELTKKVKQWQASL